MKLTLINRPPVSSTIASPAVSPAEGEIGAPPKLHPEARVKDDPGTTNSNAAVDVSPAVDEIAAPPSTSTKEQHPRPRHTDDSSAPPTNSKKAESNAHRGLSDANTTGLSSTVKETLAACPQCVSLSQSPLVLSQSLDRIDSGSLLSEMLELMFSATLLY
jgi:hypothetical protein